jgi:endonuclease III
MVVEALAQSRPALPRRADTIRRELEHSLLYSEELDIDLAKRSDSAYFRWFLASLLFGARISETTAKNTYRSFMRRDLTAPERILEAGWDFLVDPVMREGGYVRYDGRKSTQVLRDCETLIADYGGRPSRLHDSSRDAGDLEQRLLAFYGVGPVTVNIFLRELRPVWAKADPDPLPTVERLAERLSVDLSCYRRKSMVFARVEAGLLRRRRELVAA